MHTASESTMFLASGTMVGTVNECEAQKKIFDIPEIVITGSSVNNLNQSQCCLTKSTLESAKNNHETGTEWDGDCECEGEGVALLKDDEQQQDKQTEAAAQPNNDDEFEQFILNRTISENNMLDSSIYSELQFQPSVYSGGSIAGGGGYTVTDACSMQGNMMSSASITSSGQQPAPQVIPPAPHGSMAGSNQQVDVLNTSLCSRESRQSRRLRRKHKTKSKCNSQSNLAINYPPRYTAIFMEPPQLQQHQQDPGTAGLAGPSQTALAVNVGQRAFLPAATSDGSRLLPANECAYFQQQRPLLNLNQRNLFEPQQPTATTTAVTLTANGSTSTPLTQRMNFCKWFSRPSLPLVIGIFALGGVACTLGGIVLGSTGLIEHSTQYLSAALLMIGIGVSLLVIAGAIWRISLPDDYENCHCYRHMETCLNCNNPYCYNRMTTANGYFYPEFQYRTPPPSYLTSLNEYAAMGFLIHPSAAAQRAPDAFRINTPPPLYRSTNSLSTYNTGSVLAMNALGTSTVNNTPPTTSANVAVPMLLPATRAKQSQHSLDVVPENSTPNSAHRQPLTKELNYLELD